VALDVAYDGPVGSRHGVPRVLSQRFGRCWDKSDLFVTLARAAGIPARQVAGWVPPLDAGHVWAEVQIAGEGWIPVDPTCAWLGTSVDYLPFFATEDGTMSVLQLRKPTIRRVE
jgi:transglutaminase-like putative cysteine protease